MKKASIKKTSDYNHNIDCSEAAAPCTFCTNEHDGVLRFVILYIIRKNRLRVVRLWLGR